MVDIVPNWHPLAVHFPIALASTACLLLLTGHTLPKAPLLPAAGRLLLALAAFSAVIAALLGWHAFQTVEHDAAGHVVMLRHRAWALASTAGLLALAGWDGWRLRTGRPASPLLAAGALAIAGGLLTTGWLGGEMVYRHGIGVLPSAFAEPTLPDAPQLPVTAPAPVEEAANPLLPGEHIHKDGKRHRH